MGVTRRGRTFPLVPRRRHVGIAFGAHRSPRRGPGSDVAGARPYRPGDRIGSIDWHASARLSSTRDRDEFVVREFFAEEAPRAVVIRDRRPSMALYAPPFPWLSKPAAATEAARAIVDSAFAERGYAGQLEWRREPVWLTPRGERERWRLDELADDAEHDAPDGSVARALAHLERFRGDVPTGSFVFVISDFLAEVPTGAWLRALGRGWDLVPVVVQDPTWEQSFPAVGSVQIPIADPAGGRIAIVRVGAREALERRRANEDRLARLLDGFRVLGLDPVLVGTSDPDGVRAAFALWAESRSAARRRLG